MGSNKASGFTPTSTESGNFLTRATTITSTTDKTRYDALISGLVTDTDFARLDALYILAAPDRTAAVLNLIQNNYNAVEHGTVTFTASVGYTGNGSDFYLDTGFNPETATSPHYVQDSASFGAYVLTDLSSGLNLHILGSSDSGEALLAPYYGGVTYWDINSSFAGTSSSSNAKGLWIVTRTGASATALYRNGSTTAVDTGSTSSNDVPHSAFYLFCVNRGSPSDFTALQASAAFLGEALTSAAMARIAARINTFMTAYGINVY